MRDQTETNKTTIGKWFAIKRYQLAQFMHLVRDNTLVKIATDPVFDRSIGSTREERNKNLCLMGERWDAKGPKPEDYGLRSEDVNQ